MRNLKNPQGPGSYKRGYLYVEDEPFNYLVSELKRIYQIEIVSDEIVQKDPRSINGIYELKREVLDILVEAIPSDYLVTKVDDKTYKISKSDRMKLER